MPQNLRTISALALVSFLTLEVPTPNATAGEGQFTIPDYVLAKLPDGMFSAEGVARFEAAGLDLGGVFRWLDTVTYLDLVLGPSRAKGLWPSG
jgi:hypothetical protein